MDSSLTHRSIAAKLRTSINQGDLKPGDPLPSEVILSEREDVSRNAIRRALGMLANEGLIHSEAGRGWFVRQTRYLMYRPQREYLGGTGPLAGRFQTEAAAEGRVPSQTIDVALIPAPPDVAQRLEIPTGSTVLVRRRVHSLDGVPYKTNDSYFPLAIIEGTDIMSPIDIPQGANRVLAEMGHEQVKALDEIYIRMPTPNEAHLLDLGPGTPVGVHYSTNRDTQGVVVRVTVNVLPSDKNVIVWERERPLGGGAKTTK